LGPLREQPPPEKAIMVWLDAFEPSDHITPSAWPLSSASIGVAVPTTNSYAGNTSGLSVVFISRTVALTR